MDHGQTTQNHPEQDRTLPLQDCKAGSRIGAYRILDKLGEGGMGIVYLADQTEPVRRKVALKIVKLGFELREVIARFESERQAMALMEHPCIAGIYDAGVTNEGLPYFIMEYVPGLPITRFCDHENLSLAERLELFTQVCEAVQHAHHKAIIHRDLKPSNILVHKQDGRPLPKIIDFGVAKTLAQPLTDKTLHTGLGNMVGTPTYMSPEQADLARQNVDTRTDVYSLGGVLYELLVGSPPIDLDRVRQAHLEELLRMIREEEPAKPSRRFRALSPEVARKVAQERQTDPQTLDRRLRGDLDWITMKALDKDRNRRYDSPGEMVADIRRFLENKPVTARPPSLGYRVRKFTRRHRLAVASTAALAALILAFAVVLAIQARRIVEERDRANLEAETAREVATFLTNLFRLSDPFVAQGRQPTARDLLDRGAERIRESLSGQPRVQIRLQKTIAEAYENLGLYAEAEPLYTQALRTQQGLLGPEHIETVQTMTDLYGLKWRRGQLQEAETGLLETVRLKKKLLGDEHPSTLNSENNLASIYMLRGRHAEAERLYRECLDIRRRVQGPDHPDTLGASNNLANLYSRLGRHKEAGELYRLTYDGRRRVQGENHPDTIGAESNLAEHHSELGRFPDAERLHLQVLERRRRVLGEKHPDTLTTLNNLGDLYRRSGRAAQAEPYLVQALEGRRERLGEEHPDFVTSIFNLGKLRQMQGRLEESETLLRRARDEWTKFFGGNHDYVFQAKDGLARVHYARKQYAEAEAVFREILTYQKTAGADPSAKLDTLFNLACVNALQSDRRDALDFLRQAVQGGFSDAEAFSDPDLRLVQNDPDFRELVGSVRQRSLPRAK
jgi:non-specific serine/threonine protein kinase/serine/threonine-protein kinase